MYLSIGIAISDSMYHFISNHYINEIAQSPVVMIYESNIMIIVDYEIFKVLLFIFFSYLHTRTFFFSRINAI